MPFLEHAKRFEGLAQQCWDDAEAASREVQELEAIAARAYARVAAEGVPGFNRRLCNPKLNGNPITDMRRWALCWRTIAAMVAANNPGLMRDPYTILAGAVEHHDAKRGVTTTTYPHARWRARAADDAAICRVLESMRTDSRPVKKRRTGRPRESNERQDRAILTAWEHWREAGGERSIEAFAAAKHSDRNRRS